MKNESFLIKITDIFEELVIPYLITGGIAVTVWGRPRATFDIDIVIELKKKKLPLLIKKLDTLFEEGYISEEAAQDALERKGEFNFIVPETGLKIDFWVAKKDKYSELKFKRKKEKKFNNKKIYFISPEDLILEKMKWYKQTPSLQQLEDIESVLEISEVNREYIRKWSKKQSTLKILKRVLGRKTK